MHHLIDPFQTVKIIALELVLFLSLSGAVSNDSQSEELAKARVFVPNLEDIAGFNLGKPSFEQTCRLASLGAVFLHPEVEQNRVSNYQQRGVWVSVLQSSFISGLREACKVLDALRRLVFASGVLRQYLVDQGQIKVVVSQDVPI